MELLHSLCILLCCLLSVGVRAEVIASLSYVKAPFLHFDHEGSRIVPKWTRSGTAAVLQNYVRLTQDSAGPFQDGALYSRPNVDVGNPGEFSVLMKFRISGQGPSVQSNNGHQAFLFTNANSHSVPGPFFGLKDAFYGIAIVIRDGAVVSNDLTPGNPRDMRRMPGGLEGMGGSAGGEHPSFEHHGSAGGFGGEGGYGGEGRGGGEREKKTQVIEVWAGKGSKYPPQKLGYCNAEMRYREDRDNFSVLQGSRVRMRYADNRIELEVDPRNLGMWQLCVLSMMPEPRFFDRGWNDLHIRMAAGTMHNHHGTHDILEMRVWDTQEEAWNSSAAAGVEVGNQGTQSTSTEDQLNELVAHLEHELFEVNDKLSASLAWLESRRETDELRIRQLEQDLSEKMTEAMVQRIRALERQVMSQIMPELHQNIHDVETMMDNDIVSRVETVKQSVHTAWRLPFFMVVVGMAVMAIGVSKMFAKIKRDNYYG